MKLEYLPAWLSPPVAAKPPMPLSAVRPANGIEPNLPA